MPDIFFLESDTDPGAGPSRAGPSSYAPMSKPMVFGRPNAGNIDDSVTESESEQELNEVEKPRPSHPCEILHFHL